MDINCCTNCEELIFLDRHEGYWRHDLSVFCNPDIEGSTVATPGHSHSLRVGPTVTLDDTTI